MMVKNEEKNLERCLNSLKHLRDKISSELIIVDTGSTDNTVHIAKSYTGQVYFHPWNNNFSEMRNITISYATGDWIMIIDADEELVDDKEILEFLSKCNLRAAYGACLINVVNMLTTKKEDEAVLASPRLFKNDGTFHYTGKVHNQPSWQGQAINLNSTLYHYGYDSTDTDLMEKKFQRTTALLLEELNENPNNVYLRYQLAVSYSMHNDLDQGLSEIRRAYNTIFEQKQDPLHAIYVYGRYASLTLALKQFDEAEKICLEGISLKAEYIDLYYLIATLYELQGKDKAAIKYFEEYLRLIRKFNNLKLSKNHNIQFYFLGKVNESKLKLSCLYLRAQDYASSLCLSLELVKAKEQYPEGIDQAIANFVEAAIKSQDNKKLIDFYLQFTEREERICFLNNLEINKRSLEENRQKEITDLFAQGKDSYAILNQIRIGYDEGRLAEEMKNIQELATTLDFNNQPDFYSELLFYLMQLEQKIADIICNITKEKAEQLIIYLLRTQKSARNMMVKYIFEIQDCIGFQELRFCKILLKNTLLLTEQDDDDYIRLFKKYIEIGLRFIRLAYSQEAMEQKNWVALEKEDRFILQVCQAREEIGRDNYHQAVDLLKAALKTWPEFNKGIEILTKDLQVSTDSAAKEFEQYSAQIKTMIENLINKEELASATSLLNEVERILGEDSELVSMKAVIHLKQGDLDSAEQLLKDALIKDVNNFDFLYNLAYTYEMKHSFDKAFDYFKKAKSFCKDKNLTAAIEEHLNDLRKDYLLKNNK